MQNERSGARRQHKGREGEVLSPAEVDAAARDRGRTLKRIVRASFALLGIYADSAIADELGVQRGALAGWWTGAQIKPDNIATLAEVTGLSYAELTEFVYRGGPPPHLPELVEVGRQAADEGHRRASTHRSPPSPDTPARRPSPRAPASGE